MRRRSIVTSPSFTRRAIDSDDYATDATKCRRLVKRIVLSEAGHATFALEELQQLATAPKVPEPLCASPDYHCFWHGHKGYSGVALLLRRARFAEPPEFVHPPFDLEHRIVVAASGPLVFGSVYVPNGGKDFRAKMKFLRELDAWAAALQAAGKHLVLCGDFNVARTDLDVHPTLRKPMIGQSADERLGIDKATLEEMLRKNASDEAFQREQFEYGKEQDAEPTCPLWQCVIGEIQPVCRGIDNW